ncbi:MAG: hypothetical protein AB7S36_20745 [Planctomycetota bacterium]
MRTAPDTRHDTGPASTNDNRTADAGTLGEPGMSADERMLRARIDVLEHELRRISDHLAGARADFRSPGPAGGLLEQTLDRVAAALDAGKSPTPPASADANANAGAAPASVPAADPLSAEEEARRERIRQLEAEFNAITWRRVNPNELPGQPSGREVSGQPSRFIPGVDHPDFIQMENERNAYLKTIETATAEELLAEAHRIYDRADHAAEAGDVPAWGRALWGCSQVLFDISTFRRDVDISSLLKRKFRYKQPGIR